MSKLLLVIGHLSLVICPLFAFPSLSWGGFRYTVGWAMPTSLNELGILSSFPITKSGRV
ncbi:hypothetical protein [Coleofasciculus sp. F4-SAH-05]|uniref:hypothetical protein n=1 Tax=Coleofasciculus sp. F4-SAH-05 TaxID=3069525 RepID=UPI0032F789D8